MGAGGGERVGYRNSEWPGRGEGGAGGSLFLGLLELLAGYQQVLVGMWIECLLIQRKWQHNGYYRKLLVVIHRVIHTIHRLQGRLAL